MPWEKSPAELIERFHAALPEDPRVQRRQMFGYPAAFVGGNHFAGTFQASIVVRLDEAGYRELLALPGAAPFEPMPGRSMRGYAVLPEAVEADPTALSAWLERSFIHAAAMPAKVPKARTPRKKASG